jgi:hypothetical protein
MGLFGPEKLWRRRQAGPHSAEEVATTTNGTRDGRIETVRIVIDRSPVAS